MSLDIQLRDKVQADIDRLKILREKMINFSYKDENDKSQTENEYFRLTFELYDTPVLNGMFPFDLDNSSYGLDVIFMDKLPVIPSYEKIGDNLYVLWDTNHVITKLADYFQSDFNRITDLFIKGIEKIKPDILALELANDVGQFWIDAYLNKEESKEDVKFGLMMLSETTDDFTVLLDHAKKNNIKPVAIDITERYLGYLRAIPRINTLHEKVCETETFSIEYFKRKERLDNELSKLRDEYMVPKLDELTKEGKTLFIAGAGHRPNLIEALKI
ncbi:MAG: hypothetical protein KAJ20_00400 [Candidatus Aenigmarchaeota archaeon]|nr:hypothetical protein [Candidatus Aenigmarchaeota archaeon]